MKKLTLTPNQIHRINNYEAKTVAKELGLGLNTLKSYLLSSKDYHPKRGRPKVKFEKQ